MLAGGRWAMFVVAGASAGDPRTEVVSVAVMTEVPAAATTAGPDGRDRVRAPEAFFEDLTHAQIAERCPVPLGTVRSDIRRGLEKRRDQLGGFDSAPE